MKCRKILYIFLPLVILFFKTAFAEKQRIKVGLRETDMPYYMPFEELENYRKKINEYFVEKTKDNKKLNNYELDIYFYPYPSIDQSGRNLAFTFMTYLCTKLPKREYDMIVIDDRILLNEITLMESEWVYKNHKMYHPSIELFQDLSKYINKEDLEFHDPKILSGGMYKNKIIGIPFEFDFDVMYYKKELYSNANSDIKFMFDNMKNITWKGLFEKLNSNSLPIILSFADDDNLLNFVTEYASSLYNLSSKYDPNYFKLFYNDTSTSFYTELRDLIMPTIEKSRYSYDPRNVATVTLDNAFLDFKFDNSTFFKGKASHDILFKKIYTNEEVLFILPPKYQSATIHKYLVANKYSKVDPEILAEVALVLTDKDAQLFRSELFSTIPTFDFTKKDSDAVQKYCSTNSVICDAMDKMKKLDVKDIFKSDYMVAFYEIVCSIPIKFKNYFITNDINYIKNALKNANEFITDDLGPYGALSILTISFTIIFCIFVIFMTYKLREHAYIKVISPLFCNLIIIGCILNMIKLFKFIPPYSSTKIKIFLLIETIGTNLIYIPMFAVAYRIFVIYKTKTFMSNKLNNKRLLIGVMVSVSIAVIYNLIIVLTNRFYYITMGSISVARFPVGKYSNFDTFNKIYQMYLTIVVSITILNIY